MNIFIKTKQFFSIFLLSLIFFNVAVAAQPDKLASDKATVEKLGFQEMLEQKKYAEVFSQVKALSDAGNIEATSMLALMYEQGSGTNADEKQAFSLYEKAASHGDDFSQLRIAIYYIMGEHVEQNFAQAYAWLILARQSKEIQSEVDKWINKLRPRLHVKGQKSGLMYSFQLQSDIRKNLDTDVPSYTADDKALFESKCQICHLNSGSATFDSMAFGEMPMKIRIIYDEFEKTLFGSKTGLMGRVVELPEGFDHAFADTLNVDELHQVIQYGAAQMFEENDLSISESQLVGMIAAGPPPPPKTMTVEQMDSWDEKIGLGAGEEGSAPEIYKKFCAACHDTGVSDAPKKGDLAAWNPRLRKRSLEEMVQHVIADPIGHPMRGLCQKCSEKQLEDVIYEMYRQP